MTENTLEMNKEAEHRCLVIVDDSAELERALYYACRRAKNLDGRVVLLHCTDKPDSGHFMQFMGIGDRLEEEAREGAEQLLYDLAEKVFQWSKKHAIVVIETDLEAALPRLVEDEGISIIIQPMTSKDKAMNPATSYLLNEGAAAMHIPVTLVPATMTIDEINSLT